MNEPADFDDFWRDTMAETGRYDLDVRRSLVDTGLDTLSTMDVTFRGFAGHDVHAWLHLPAHRSGRLPLVVEFLGYGSGRGLPQQRTFWATAGFAHLVVDNRGQMTWHVGDTPDPTPRPYDRGHLITGVDSPAGLYHRRLYADAARAVAAGRSFPEVDPGRIAVTGRSQGGATCLAAAALADGVTVVMPDVPYLCDIREAVRRSGEQGYAEIIGYLRVHHDDVDALFTSLSYVDAAAMAKRAAVPSLWSVGGLDAISPPETVRTAYERHPGPKDICVYPFNGHEGGETAHLVRQIHWLRETFGVPARPYAGNVHF